MKRVIRENINTPYSLHDMNVINFEVNGNDMIMRTQSGMVNTAPPYSQPDGYVEFLNVQWEFSYVYILDHHGNVGKFAGEKKYLKDFVNSFTRAGFSIIDQNYGYNQTKFSGYLSRNHRVMECIIEIYHEGDMVYVVDEA